MGSQADSGIQKFLVPNFSVQVMMAFCSFARCRNRAGTLPLNTLVFHEDKMWSARADSAYLLSVPDM